MLSVYIMRLLAIAARLGIILVVFGAFVPPQPRAPLGEAHTVETIQPHVCVHTRLIDEVETWKIQKTLIDVREMGARTIVEFFPWAYIEGTRGLYDWTSVDRIVEHAQNQGIRIIARMGLVPEWARENSAEINTTLNSLAHTNYPAFADFVAAFAVRYSGIIDHLIIWNEPNLAFEWGYQTVDPAGYAELLRVVYATVKDASPLTQVLAAGLAPTLEPSGSPNGLNDLLYLEALYEHGAAAYFDALAVHTYGFTQPAEADPAPDQLNFRRVELLRAVMMRHDDAHKPVFITESGWNDSPRWINAVTPAQRITYTLDALAVADTWAWLDSLCLWAFRTPAPTFNYPDYFTLVNVDFQRKPIYTAVQAYARGFDTP